MSFGPRASPFQSHLASRANVSIVILSADQAHLTAPPAKHVAASFSRRLPHVSQSAYFWSAAPLPAMTTPASAEFEPRMRIQFAPLSSSSFTPRRLCEHRTDLTPRSIRSERCSRMDRSRLARAGKAAQPVVVQRAAAVLSLANEDTQFLR